MNLIATRADDHDVAFLAELFLRSMRASITAARGSWDDRREMEQFVEQLQVSRTEIIRQDGVGVGFVMAIYGEIEVELHTICVAPEYQGRGIGTWAVRKVLAAAGRRGIVLSVLKANTEARGLYERLGFAVMEESEYHLRMRFRLDS